MTGMRVRRFKNIAALFCIIVLMVAAIVAFLARGNVFTKTKGWLILRGSMVAFLTVTFLLSLLCGALEMSASEDPEAKAGPGPSKINTLLFMGLLCFFVMVVLSHYLGFYWADTTWKLLIQKFK